MGRRERPLDPEAGPLESFALELRRLRQAAGLLSYRELARRAHYSKTVLSEAAGGRELPTLAVTLAYVDACGGDRREWEARWCTLAAKLTPDGQVTGEPESRDGAESRDEAETGDCPYPGLAAFQPEDAERFFGREQLVADLVTRLDQAPFLAVFGPSGSGKSSVLRAGLLPAVWGGSLPGASSWTTILLTPGPHPLEELVRRMPPVEGIAPGELLEELRASPDRLRLTARKVVADGSADARLLLVVDQFEEIFTLCRDDTERRDFVQALVRMSGDATGSAKVVLGVRADFYARCADYPELVAALADHQVLVGPMTADDLRRTIEGPAERVGLDLEPGLVQTVLGDIGAEPGSLPLLSHALYATWQRRRGRTLTTAGYQDAGGVRQAIAQTADTVYGELSPAQQVIAKTVFLRLTTLGEGTEDTRRRVERAELGGGEDIQPVELVLDRLAQARLVTLDEDTVEVAHEALIRCWPRLRRWLNEDRDALRAHRRLTEAANEWETLGRDPGALYRGARLAAARESTKGRDGRFNELERTFLAASNERERNELETARRRNRRLRALAGTLAVLLVLVATVGVVQVQKERRLVLARQLAHQASVYLDQQALSLLLSLESWRLAPTDQVLTVLLQGLQKSPVRGDVLSGHEKGVNGVAFSPDGNTIASASFDDTVRLWHAATGEQIRQLDGHTDQVYGVAFSPNGETIASASLDKTVRLWSRSTGEQIRQLGGHTDAVWEVTFSPDGATIASASADGTVRLWDFETGEQRRTLIGHGNVVRAVAFNHNGTRIASAGRDDMVRLWEVETGVQIGEPLKGHTSTVWEVAFSSDGTRIVSGSADRTVRLWNTLTGAPLEFSSAGHEAEVRGVAFSPDDKTIVSSSNDRKVRLRDATTGALIGSPLTGHTGTVWEVVFSPDGTRIASAGGDGTVRVWNVAEVAFTSPLGLLVTGHTDKVHGVAFSPDGARIASAGADGSVRLWCTETGKPIGPPLTGHNGPVRGVAFSKDNNMIASAGEDRTVRLWNAATGQQIGQLEGHTEKVYGVAFSSDNKMIASAGADNSVRLWNAETRKPSRPALTGHTGPVRAVAFNSDGTRIVSAGDDRTVRLWDVTTGQQIGQLEGHTEEVYGVAFSPDSSRIASASIDRSVRLWDAFIREPIGLPLTRHTDKVYGVTFNHDGTRIASVGGDGTVWLWDAITHEPIGASFDGHTGEVYGVAFSPNGTTIASTSADWTVQLWPATIDLWMERACTLAGRNLSKAEWDRFLPGRPYARTCPDLPAGDGAMSGSVPSHYR